MAAGIVALNKPIRIRGFALTPPVVVAAVRVPPAGYLVDLNATQSAILAGYSEKTAEQQGYENLRKAEAARVSLN